MKKSIAFLLFAIIILVSVFVGFFNGMETRVQAVVPTNTPCVFIPGEQDCYGFDPTIAPTFTDTPEPTATVVPTNTKRPPYTPTNTPTCEPGDCYPIDPTINPKLGGVRNTAKR